MALDHRNLLSVLGLVGFVAALGLWFSIGGLPWWIAMGPLMLIVVVVGVGIYLAWRGSSDSEDGDDE